MDASAEQCVLDYLSRLGDAAQQTLRPDDQVRFMARSRAAIARQIGETRASDTADVLRLLRAFGDPDKLAGQERRRLDAETVPRGAQRPVTVASHADSGWDLLGILDRSDRRDKGEAAASDGPVAPDSSAVPDGLGASDGSAVPPRQLRPNRSQSVLKRVFDLARRYPLESVGIVLLAIGGVIYPFPLWLFGVLAVLISRYWDRRAKLIALAVPVITALFGAVVVAGLSAKSGSLSGYAHALGGDGWNLLRFGVVIGAAYLGWRLHQGPRPQREPPWRRPQQGSTTWHGAPPI